MPASARRTARKSINTDDRQQNGEPPASTFAAQIADNFTTNKAHSKHQDRGQLRTLLREILNAKEDVYDSASPKSSLEENCRLVYVVFTAGVEAEIYDDPFNDQDDQDDLVDLVDQIVESLKVVELTLRKSPEILYHCLEGSEHFVDTVCPLYIWLLPKLFNLLGHTKDITIILETVQVFKTILAIDQKRISTAENLRSISRYLGRCVLDLIGLRTFHNSNVFSKWHPHLDLGQCSMLLDDRLQGSILATSRCSISRSTVATCILLAMTSPNLKSAKPMEQRNFRSTNCAWVLSCLQRLWQHITPVETFLAKDGAEKCLVYMLDVLQNIHDWIYLVSKESDTRFDTVIFLSHIITKLLPLQSVKGHSALEEPLSHGLGLLTYYSLYPCYASAIFRENLLPALQGIKERHNLFNPLGKVLQQHIESIISACSHQHESSSSLTSLNHWSSFEKSKQSLHDLSLCISENNRDTEDRPSKRLRLSDCNGDENYLDLNLELMKELSSLAGQPDSVDIGEPIQVLQAAANQLDVMSEEEQTLTLLIAGKLVCAEARTLSIPKDLSNKPSFHTFYSTCEGNGTRCLSNDIDTDKLFTIFTKLCATVQKHKWRRPRITALIAMRHFLSHSKNFAHLDLASSELGRLCLLGLKSSVRDIRIAAGRTLPIFLREGIPDELLSNNRISVLDFLRNLSEIHDLQTQETCVLAWGQIARISSGDEMNIILLRFLEYLGHTNPIICAIAFEEVQCISNHSIFQARKLFMPFWRTIAPAAVKSLQRRPQVTHHLCDLLGMSVSEFLHLTQVHTIPYLVLIKNRNILQKIADSCSRSIPELCMESSNMAAILSCILLEASAKSESTIMDFLTAISSEFRNVNCEELIGSHLVSTSSELLKAASEDGGTRQSMAYQALKFLTAVKLTKSANSRSVLQDEDRLSLFFEVHVLGIMAYLADTINDGRAPQPTSEKLRCLGAIQEMVKLARGSLSNGLPQICACLRSAIENSELANSAFTTWIILIDYLGQEEIKTLIDPTFAIIAQYWDCFAPRTQDQAHSAVRQLLKSHTKVIRDNVKTIPSLASIPLMSKFEEEISRLKAQIDIKHQYQAFSERCQSENVTVVLRALVELEGYLTRNQHFIHEAAMHEQPDPVVSQLVRSILDACVLLKECHLEIPSLCARCLGLIGCLDPIRIDAARQKREMLVLSDFGEVEETKDFIIFFLREVLVKAFRSSTNPRAQGFFAYAMQQLLKFIQFDASIIVRSRVVGNDMNYYRWAALPESVRNTLSPFLTSSYVVTRPSLHSVLTYPIYGSGMTHRVWLRNFTLDLLHKGVGENVQYIFPILSKTIRPPDISIAEFLLPFAALNIIISERENSRQEIAKELLHILELPLPERGAPARENLILCSQNVFQLLDYLSRWMQEKKKETANERIAAGKVGRALSQPNQSSIDCIQRVSTVLSTIPAEVISRRAVECKSFARALFHWEQFIRQQKMKYHASKPIKDLEPLYERLQDIYTQIDEPDGIEGISSFLHVLNIDQQVLEHRKAGRWTAAQSWYELLLTKRPNDLDVQFNLLTCLNESAQHDVMLNQVDSFQQPRASALLALPFAVEASWVTGKWTKLKQYLAPFAKASGGDFNVGIGRALLALSEDDNNQFSQILENLRQDTARSLSASNTSSLQACQEAMLKLHAITEVDTISNIHDINDGGKLALLASLNKKLDLLGTFVSKKNYILGLRRAAMHLSRHKFSHIEIASTWLTTAKLARKSGFIHSAFNAVLHASQLGDVSATIENSRLLWSEGHHRRAIQSLEGAIAANAFRSHDYPQESESLATTAQCARNQQQNLVKAKAHLLLAKWIDRAGQTQSESIISRYQHALQSCNRWEKGHYHLGKHYNKLLESEKAKAPEKQAQTFITGETAKLVVENYLRSLAFGAKYIYQTLPRILTLWLELGSNAEQPLDPKHGNDEHFRTHTTAQRRKLLGAVNTQIKKYIDRLPAFIWYTAFAQIVARLCHSDRTIYGLLVEIIAKIVISHPHQALWTLLALLKSSSKDRAERGKFCLSTVTDTVKAKQKSGSSEVTLALIIQAQRLSDNLLHVCENEIQGKPTTVSISRDLGFNHKAAPCKLVVPLESTLTASLPTVTENVNMKSHKAFTRDTITISTVLEDVLVLNSLQRPRKIMIRGSDGNLYALLCKPKDDLRKDQRLMEFNAMINRSLKKDAQASKRRLYIKTYAVTPLNEECGLIEWVDNLKTLRDILLNSYKQKNIVVNYGELRTLLAEAISEPGKLHIFTEQILGNMTPCFHEWFVEMFPEPSAWFAARLKYTRSCAVMSMVGHVLGLGDRHGENILFEEGSGGTFHVDFNCLFDKGKTFDKPELVPFRLTHNMVDAFGAYGYEGPYRKSCELTIRILRQNEDTLMTILETFLYDPTTDFIGKKKRKSPAIVPDTPEGVLEQVRNKFRGLLPMESVPLSVEGYVQKLIEQATDPFSLASMYIGWCAFF